MKQLAKLKHREKKVTWVTTSGDVKKIGIQAAELLKRKDGKNGKNTTIILFT